MVDKNGNGNKIYWLKYVAPMVMICSLIGSACIGFYRLNIIEASTEDNHANIAVGERKHNEHTIRIIGMKKDVESIQEDVGEIKVAQNSMGGDIQDIKLMLVRMEKSI